MNSKQFVKFLLLFSLVFVFFFLGLGGYDLTAPDEPRFGLVAREMLRDNHWVLPHRNGNPYPDKPPFFFWTIAAFSALAGGSVNAWTARLPSAVSAVLILFLIWRWGNTREEQNFRPILTVLVLLSCAKFFFQARIAQIDMVLCLFTTVALITGYNAVTKKQYSPFCLGMVMGLGVLTKGPVGYLIPAGALGLFILLNKKFNKNTTWRDYPLKGLMWGLVPVLAWFILLVLEVALNNQWVYLNNLMFKQTLTRYFDSWHHHQPFDYFFVTILYDFLPWTPFLLISIPFTKKKWRLLDSRERYSWVVMIFTIIFFSLSKGKRSIYILPTFPFAAYVVAARIDQLLVKKKWSWEESGAGFLTGIILFIVGTVFISIGVGWVGLPDHLKWIDTSIPREPISIAGVLLVLISIEIFISAHKNRTKWMFSGIIVGMLVVNLLSYSVIFPWLNPFRSTRGFMEKANHIISSQSENPVVGMVAYRSGYRLYGDFPLVELSKEIEYPPKNLPKISDFFDKYPEGWLIVREKHWKQFSKNHPIDVTIHLKKKIGSRKSVLLLTQKTY